MAGYPGGRPWLTGRRRPHRGVPPAHAAGVVEGQVLHLTAQRWLGAALGTTGRLGRLNRGFGGAVAVRGVGLGVGASGMARCDASINHIYI